MAMSKSLNDLWSLYGIPVTIVLAISLEMVCQIYFIPREYDSPVIPDSHRFSNIDNIVFGWISLVVEFRLTINMGINLPLRVVQRETCGVLCESVSRDEVG